MVAHTYLLVVLLPQVIFLVHLVVLLGLGSPIGLCTRIFIATPNLKKQSTPASQLLVLYRANISSCRPPEAGIFGAVGFCDSKRRSRVGSGPIAEMIHAISAQVRGLIHSILCFLCLDCTSLRATCCCSSTTSLLLLLKYYVARAPR